MKKIKYLLLVFLFSIFFINNVESVTSLPFSFTLIEDGRMNDNNSIFSGYDGGQAAYFSYKYSTINGNSYIVLCTGDRTASANSGGTYSKNNEGWNTKTRLAIGQIFKNGIGVDAKTSSYGKNSKVLYATQIAVWKYLTESGVYKQDNLTYTIDSMKQNCTECYNTYNSLMSAAQTAEGRSNNVGNFSITPSSTSLTFTKSGDYYVSNAIKINGSYMNSSTLTATISSAPSGSTITGNNTDGYIVKVPVSSLNVGANNVSISFSANSTSYYLASNYSAGESYQTLTISLLEEKTESASTSLSGSISINTALTLKKIDKDGKYLSGSTVKITKDGEDFGEYNLPNKDYIINGLSYGEYCITEVKAPDGYILSDEEKCINLSSNNLNGTLSLTNTKNLVKFKKVSLVDGKYELLPGAILKIVDSKGNQIYDIDGNILKWETDENVYTVNGLSPGIYYLVEEKSPNGYSISKKIKFVVTQKYVVSTDLESILGIMDKDTLTIVMENELIKTSFSKLDATTEKELPGATLQVLDKDKKPITDEEGNVLYKWISTDEPYIIEGLPIGIYYLKEVIAPNGYTKTEELVEFEVKDDGTITEVVMKNSPIIEVPNTSRTASIPMIILSVVLLISGVGIIVFVNYKIKKLN